MTRSGINLLAALIVVALATTLSSYQRGSALDVDPGSGVVWQRVIAGAEPPPSLSEGSDPELEPGFPVSTPHVAGAYQSGPGIHTLVGNIDGDPELEIVTTALTSGPLYAWNHDGSPVAGWPLSGPSGTAFPALGKLARIASAVPKLEIFTGHPINPALWALRGNGTNVPGWPLISANGVSFPGTLADVDGDGRDEIFIAEEDWGLHGYRANGSVLSGWPVHETIGGQQRHTPAVADLDGAGGPEVVTVTGQVTGGAYLLGYYSNGATLPGFPKNLPSAYVHTFPAVGDVDGDGALEMLIMRNSGPPPSNVAQVEVRSAGGVVERILTCSRRVAYGTAPALADLDGDSVPEIIVLTDGAVDVWKGNGAVFTGWPRLWSDSHWIGNSAPVVGDVTGDGLPEIIVTSHLGGTSDGSGEVRVFDRYGNMHPSFPKSLPIGKAAVPAIADIDLDGRNEIIVSGAFWNGVPGIYPKVWAYDLGGGTHGAIQWGQFMGGPRHQGRYGQPIE